MFYWKNKCTTTKSDRWKEIFIYWPLIILRKHYVVQTELEVQNSDVAMIFTFLKRLYSRSNKKWADSGYILKIEPTGVAHALVVGVKKGN